MAEAPRPLAASSWLVSAGRPTAASAPLNAPLIPASNFLHGGERSYAREDGTDTWEALEAVVARLEEGRAVSFSSGMAAIAAVADGYGSTTTSRSSLSMARFISRPRVCELGAWPQ